MQGANSSSGLRGDYSRMRPDYTVDQRDHRYTAAEQRLWRRLYARQMDLLPGYACAAFMAGVQRASCAQAIPDLERVSGALHAATGWRLVAVPGFIPDAVFFTHLAARRFPVTVWLRKPQETDYLVEPDLFHDFFGHVPMLFDPGFAGYMQRYGEQALRALAQGALHRMARLYWYTVEFGLIDDGSGLRAYGAGILSSHAETVRAVESPEPQRLNFSLSRCMRTQYRIDDYQQTYFVIHSLDELAAALAGDLARLWRRLMPLADRKPGQDCRGDRHVPPRAAPPTRKPMAA